MHIPDFTLGHELTAEQQSFFEEHGFIRFRGVATRDECDVLCAALDSLSSEWVETERESVLGIPLQWGYRPMARSTCNLRVLLPLLEQRQGVLYLRPLNPSVACGEEARLAQTEKDGVVVNDFINDEGSTWESLAGTPMVCEISST